MDPYTAPLDPALAAASRARYWAYMIENYAVTGRLTTPCAYRGFCRELAEAGVAVADQADVPFVVVDKSPTE